MARPQWEAANEMAIKVGIIGAGGMVQYHAQGFNAAGAELVAIADVNRTAAEQAAEEYGINTVYDDVATMLATEH